MTAEEKLALMAWCRDEAAIHTLTNPTHPRKLVKHSEASGLRAIWRPIPIATQAYSLCAQMQHDGQLASITFRNLGTDASLKLTSHRSGKRLQAFQQVARSLTA